MKKTLLLIVGICVYFCNLSAQSDSAVTGIVSNAVTGAALPGVTVTASNNKIATQTKGNGAFTLLLRLPDTLYISHTGFETAKIILENNAPLQVRLVPLGGELETITINTGYQRLKPNEVNGSYTLIDNKALNQQTGTNILDRLNGITSSLLVNMGKSNRNPQNTTNISIRGLSTINGPLDPLIVVDNFIYEGNIANINPNDVESVTILKDAAAASIWGARAGNGVIVITMKKGRWDQKINIGISANTIITGKPDLYSLSQLSSSDYIDLEQQLFRQGYYDGTINSRTRPALSPAVYIFKNRRSGLISAQDSALEINALMAIDNREQYMKYFYEKALTQQYAVNLSGGSSSMAWLISGAYDHSRDQLNNNIDKINLRIKNDYRPFKHFTVHASVFFTSSTALSGRPDYNATTSVNGRKIPYLPIAGPSGRPVAVPIYNQDYTDTAGGGRLLSWDYYPLNDYLHSRTKTNRRELLAEIGMEYQFSSSLRAILTYQHQLQQSTANTHYDTTSFFTRNLINLYTQLNTQTGARTYIVPMGGILNKQDVVLNAYNFRGQLNFDRVIQKMHRISAITAVEIRAARSDDRTTRRYGYYKDPLIYSTNMDFATSYPTFITGGRAQIPSGIAMNKTENRFLSVLANAAYSFKGRYQLSGSIRQDGANIFGAKVNDRWKPLWSAGLGWVLSKENFYHWTAMPFLKLSVTYGASGNVDLGKSALPVAVMNTDPLTGLPIAQVTVINNPRLSWEKTFQTNIKADFSLREQRITGTIEYYLKKGTNLYGPTPYDYTAWGASSTIVANVAAMKGRGWDITLNSLNVNRAFKWRTSFLFNYNTAITTKYYAPQAANMAQLLSFDGSGINPVIGKPLYAIAAYRWGGLNAQGMPLGYMQDTLTTDYRSLIQNASDKGFASGSFRYIGPASPPIFGSVFNSINYKGWEISANIVYKLGYYLFRRSLSYSALLNSGQGTGDYQNRWRQPGDEARTSVPVFTYPINIDRESFYGRSEVNVIRGDQVRLQFINLSYSFNPQAHRGLSGLQVYANANNLGILWRSNKEGADPDYINSIPPPRSYTVGIRASF
ncbi:SusC/RagA family TonB-linked outer membrane protein [Niabella terrae]